MFIITCFAGDYILASVQDNDSEVIIKMTSKEFAFTNRESICISLPYYFSAKGGKLELKVVVHDGKIETGQDATTYSRTVFSPPEKSGQYWNNEQIIYTPESSVPPTKIQVDNIL